MKADRAAQKRGRGGGRVQRRLAQMEVRKRGVASDVRRQSNNCRLVERPAHSHPVHAQRPERRGAAQQSVGLGARTLGEA